MGICRSVGPDSSVKTTAVGDEPVKISHYKIFNRLLYHPKRPKAKFHVTSDQTPHLRRGSTHIILDERGNPVDSIDEKLRYLRILAICGRTIVRFMHSSVFLGDGASSVRLLIE